MLKHKNIAVVLMVFIMIKPAFTDAQSVEHWSSKWRNEWPKTDFSRTTIALEEIQPGGPGKDGIPAIDSPRFALLSAAGNTLSDHEPVIGLSIDGDARAYPLRVLMWHEIVNDTVAGIPVTVTYCPLCNTAIVFDRRLDNKILDFGTTGNLRHSDLVMYDRQTESWWQQFSGQAIVGELAGQTLTIVASRLESFENFRARAPHGKVLIANNPAARAYGSNPYVGYDSAPLPFLYKGSTPEGVPPMMRVVAVGNEAFSLPLLVSQAVIRHRGLTIAWTSGQLSALDHARMDGSRDVGNIVVTRANADVPYVVTFAFAFFAFNPTGTLHTAESTIQPGAPE